MDEKKCAIVIPARMHSTRLPNKPLLNIAGKPLLSWVIDVALKVEFKSEIIVATDNIRIKKVAEDLGIKSFLTSKNNKNGTERIIEILDNIDAEYIINLQGDEPLVNPKDLNNLFNLIESKNIDIASICHEIDSLEADEVSNVKVVLDINQNALYFSRSKVPYGSKSFYCHKGIYAFKRHTLEKIKYFKSGILGDLEDLEQLKWLENGMKIKMLVSKNKSIGVDTKDDFLEAENALLANNIKALICDIDGTLTNGLLWYGDKGEELKSFNVKDGSAIKKLLLNGFKVGFLSGRDSAPLRARADELGIKFLKFNQNDKKKGCIEILNEMKLDPLSVVYIGDDESDIPCCTLMPFSFAVNDCHPNLKKITRFHLKTKGGEGVINEVIEKINIYATNSKLFKSKNSFI